MNETLQFKALVVQYELEAFNPYQPNTNYKLTVHCSDNSMYMCTVFSASETERNFRAIELCLTHALARLGNNDYDAVLVHCTDDLVRGVLIGHWTMTPKLFQYSKEARRLMSKIRQKGLTVRIEEKP